MSATMEPIDIRDALAMRPSLGQDDIDSILRAASGPQATEFENTVNELVGEAAHNPQAAVRAGVGLFYLGRPQQAVSVLDGDERRAGFVLPRTGSLHAAATRASR